jgi:membrane protein DedA with SNARE-associated domain/membrane-associated phospholipid phosphatase
MQAAHLDALLAWTEAHPLAAGGLVFLIAFCDALAVVGIVVPALPLLFAIGVMIGLGHVSGPYALAAAACGAFAGDALSFWIGRRFGPRLHGVWPFSRHPGLLDRGERLFRRHGSKAILIARFVGAVRPFVPAVAGMLRLPLRRYAPMSAFAAIAWAACFLAPGWLFGASYDAVAAVADRLALALLALLAVLALAWAAVLYTWRWFAGRADRWLVRLLRWSRAHPRLGRYAEAMVDPNRPESASLLLLAAMLLAIGWAGFAWLAAVLARGGPLQVDQWLGASMRALRNPLADRLMAALASLGDREVLLPACALALLWLLWRRRWMAAAHWVAALGFGLALTALLGASIHMPAPPGANAAFGFPSIAVTMATIAFGFFAILIARELPGRRRVWPYLLAAVLVATLGFARLYLGMHWLSDIAGGALLGIAWLLLLGLAYRRHVARSFWMRPLAWTFYGAFALAAVWHAPRAATPLLARLDAAPSNSASIDAGAWWSGRTALPTPDARDPARRRMLDVQVAGPLAPLAERLRAAGWRAQRQANWVDVLGLLDEERALSEQPVLPGTLDARAESLLLRRRGSRPGTLQVLRVWRAPARLDDGTPLWLGSTQTLAWTHPLHAFGLWRPVAGDEAHEALRAGLGDAFPLNESENDGTRVLRVRTDAANGSAR